MKEKWNQLKQRWQRFLTRPREIVLDLVLGLVLLFLCWMFLGYPQPWEGEFRRIEEQNLVGPSEIIYHQSRRHTLAGEGRLTRDITVGLGEDWAIIVQRGKEHKHVEQLSSGYNRGYTVPGERVELYHLKPGTQLLPVTWPAQGEEKDSYGWTFLAVQLPEGTSSGVLTLALPDGTEQTLAGIPGEQDTMAFWLDDSSVNWPTFEEELDGHIYRDLRHDVWGRAVEEKNWMQGLSWHLTLKNEAGEELPVCSGSVLFSK